MHTPNTTGSNITTSPTTQTSSSNSPTLTMNNQEIKSNENKIIVENNQYEVNFKNNKLQICNKTTYNCKILYDGNNNNNIVLLINKEGDLTITNKDTDKVEWSTNTSYNNKNNFFDISNDNKFTLLISNNGDLKIIDNTNNSIKWSSIITQTTTTIPKITQKPLNNNYDDYNIGMMLKGSNNTGNLNDFIAKNTLLGNNLYISPMNQSGIVGDDYGNKQFKKNNENKIIDSTFTPMIQLG